MKTLKQALYRKPTPHIPLWVMRQAGRYLPEYRELRKSTGSFLDLCYNPEKAKEVTLQPIRRFDFDAAIIFSDILVIPHALGMDVQFKAGEGPVLERLDIKNQQEINLKLSEMEARIHSVTTFLNPVLETVRLTRKELAENKSVIGFCGAPWTVALYMLDKHPSKSSEITRELAFNNPAQFQKLINILVASSVEYLCAQIEAGANVIQIFDSWASQIPNTLFDVAVKQPYLQICQQIKAKHPHTPIILFPRGLDSQKLKSLAEISEGLFEGLGLDYSVDLNWAAQNLQPHVCIQGNMDPTVLLTNPATIKQEVEKCLRTAAANPGYIFNLGHGIIKETPIEHVEALVEAVRQFKR